MKKKQLSLKYIIIFSLFYNLKNLGRDSCIVLCQITSSISIIFKALNLNLISNFSNSGSIIFQRFSENYPMIKILLHADICRRREMRYVHQNERAYRTEIELQVK